MAPLGIRRRTLQEIRETTGPTPFSCTAQPSPPSLHPRSLKETQTGDNGQSEWAAKGGGASGREWDREEQGSELTLWGGGSTRAEAPRENEPIQSWEGKGKNLVWCLTRGEEGGRGGLADSLLPSTVPPAGPGRRAKERGCLRDKGWERRALGEGGSGGTNRVARGA